MKLSKILTVFILGSFLLAQGNFPQIPYTEKIPQKHGTIWDIKVNSYGIPFLATDKGIVIKNDNHLNLVPYKRPVRKLKLLSDKKFLFATRGDIGTFEITPEGGKFKSFAKYLNKIDKNFGEVFEILTDGQKTYYFITDNKILEFFTKKGLRDYQILGDKIFLGAVQLGEIPAVAIEEQGLVNLRNKQVLNDNEIFKTNALSEFVKIGDEYYFASYDKNQLFKLSADGKILKKFPTEIDALLRKYEIYKLQNLAGNLAVLTYYGGVFIVNPEGKLLANYTQKNSGISNTAYALGVSSRKNLLVSHANGLSEIFTSLPVSDFSSLTKNVGEINAVLEKNNLIYLATTQGTFLLKNNSLKKIHPSESWDLREYQGKILVATLDGVYQISGENPSLFESLTNTYKLSVQNNFLYIFTTEGIFKYSGNKPVKKFSVKLFVPTGIYELNDKEAVITTLSSGIVLWDSRKDKYKSKLFEPQADAKTGLVTYKNKKLLYTSEKIYVLSQDKKLSPWEVSLPEGVQISELVPDKQGNLWILNQSNPLIFNGKEFVYNHLARFFEGVQNVFAGNNNVLLTQGNKVFFLQNTQPPEQVKSVLILNYISHHGDTVYFYEPLENYKWSAKIPYKYNRLKIAYGLPGSPGKNLYRYSLGEEFSDWNSRQEIEVGPLSEGKYRLKLQAKNPFVKNFITTDFTFSVAPPWYRAWYAYLAYAFLLIAAIYGGVRAYTSKLKADKERLERIVEERTHELRQTNEELSQVNEELKQINEELKIKNEQIYEAKLLLEEQHNAILESINYARRIQEAILPEIPPLQAFFKEISYLYLPKDKVSGDFFWYYRQGDCLYFAVVDCTGHGVPGAMMSMLGVSALNRIILQAQSERRSILPGEILEQLNKEVFDTLHVKGKDSKQNDGMDVIICRFENDGKRVQYAGAQRPLWTRYGDTIQEFPTTKNSIGAVQNVHYETFTLDYDWEQIYMFSDGVHDQLGGPRDRKLGRKNLRNILLKIKDSPTEEQIKTLHKFIEEWKKGTYKEQQTDDITFFTFTKEVIPKLPF